MIRRWLWEIKPFPATRPRLSSTESPRVGRQPWRCATADAPTSVRNATSNYLLIVTNRELSASNGARLREMYPEGKLDYPSAEARQYLPLEHVCILSIDDFERLISAVNKNKLDLPGFLVACVERDKTTATGKFFFDQHLAAGGIPYGRSNLLDETIRGATDRLGVAMQEEERAG